MGRLAAKSYRSLADAGNLLLGIPERIEATERKIELDLPTPLVNNSIVAFVNFEMREGDFMHQRLNRVSVSERRIQLAMNWCLLRIRATAHGRTGPLVNSYKWATENLHAQEFFVFADSLVGLAVDFIANDRFLDFENKEFRNGVKTKEIHREVRERIRHDTCKELNDYLREDLAVQ